MGFGFVFRTFVFRGYALGCLRRSPSAAEGVTRIGVAGLQPAAQPARALLGGAVRERLGRDVALTLSLQPIVANRGRGSEAFVDITRVEELTLGGVIAPHTREAVGLQLHPH
jgi:hypothetical protein